MTDKSTHHHGLVAYPNILVCDQFWSHEIGRSERLELDLLCVDAQRKYGYVITILVNCPLLFDGGYTFRRAVLSVEANHWRLRFPNHMCVRHGVKGKVILVGS